MVTIILVNIYTARLIIEHPREWLASLADNGVEVVSRVPDSLAVRRESGQTAYYISCNACQEILGVLIGLSTSVTYCGFPPRARESGARAKAA